MSTRPRLISDIDKKKAQDLLTRKNPKDEKPLVSTSTVTENAPRHSLKRPSLKRPAENDANETKLESNTRPTSGAKSQTIEVKRKKKTQDGLTYTDKFEKPLSGGQSDVLNSKNRVCAFCHSSKPTEGSGPLVSYAQGKLVVGNVANFSKVTHVHEKCIQWAPRVYFKNGLIQNLESEIIRANKLKCSSCGKKGAGLGCFMETCERTYHVPCAFYMSDCRWDDTYLLFCPQHANLKFPSEIESEKETKSEDVKQDTEKRISKPLNPCTTSLDTGKNLVFCCSDLSSEEKCSVVEFASNIGVVVSKYWKDNVTHVIASTDKNGACIRSYKYLMAILNGKWVVKTEWVKACIKAGTVVDEEPYEVNVDTHGCVGGPKSGRLRVLNNKPKLFDKMEFYFVGDFEEVYKTDLKNLVTSGGGTVIKSRDQLLLRNDADKDVKRMITSLVVYNADVSDHTEFDDEDSIKFQRLAAAQDIAQQSRSQIIQHIWILESIAACCLLQV